MPYALTSSPWHDYRDERALSRMVFLILLPESKADCNLLPLPLLE